MLRVKLERKTVMLALEGMKVLDLTRAAPGALCTMILGDLGADVLKIEAPPQVGAHAAGWRPPLIGEEMRKEAVYNPLNRNKKSLALNLQSEDGQKIFYRLAEKADVIIEGFRPGVVKRLGIDYPMIEQLNPRIIYCALSGYGQDGPYSHLSGHDINYISIGGALALIGERDGPPIVPLNLIADFAGASLHGVIGILAALAARHQTGTGQYLDIAYTDAVISLLTFFTGDYFREGTVIKRGETALHGAYPYYGVYETRDHKYISLGCIEPWLWENFCRAVEREDLIPYRCWPEHYKSKPDDEKWEAVSASLREIFLTRTRDEWFDFLSQKDVPVAKVYTFDEVFSDPQVRHRQMVIETDHPSVGKVSQIGIPIKMSDTPGKVRSLSPLLGEHTSEVLLDLGYTKQEIDHLLQTGIVG